MSGTQPRQDPTGDQRADLMARLEYDLMPWSVRHDATYGQGTDHKETT